MTTRRAQDLRDFAASWSLCQQCGACNARAPIIPHNWRELPPPEWASPYRRCPSFEHFGFRAYNAQGRGLLASLVFDDKEFPITDELVKIVYSCTSCGACSDICKAVDPLTAIWALRQELSDRGAEPPRALKRLHANIAAAGNLYGSAQPVQSWGLPSSGKDLFFAGCQVRYRQPKVVESLAALLQRAGVEIAYLAGEERCCGFVPGYAGAGELLESRALDNIARFAEAGATRIIVSCAHCYRALKHDYPLIAGNLPFEVVHVAELLADLLESGSLHFGRRIDQRVTYHDPCFLGRHSGVYEAPRAVIEAVPGVELVEMERSRRWSYCCGSGAKISSACHPEFGAAVTGERLKEAKRAANTIVTACTTCASRLAAGARRSEIEVSVVDLVSFAGRALS